MNFWAAAGSGFLVSLIACRALRAFALKRALLDLPNERSLHSVPVPRMGGVGIFVGCWVVVAATLLSSHPSPGLWAWLIAAIPVATLGLVDDLRPLRAAVRLMVQVSLATAVTLVVGFPNVTLIAPQLTLAIPAAIAVPIWVIWIVGVLNIYNFMDGMDGLAGSQATFAGIAVSIAFAAGGHLDLALAAAVLSAASAGFLTLNAPPAKIFMGDAGSTFIGFTFAALALLGASRPNPLPLLVTPLALAPFLLDGTFTIIRRAFRGEAIWKAHRSHLYQRAVTSGLRHQDVLLRYACWMLAAAGCAVGTSMFGPGVALIASGLMLGALALMWRWVVSRERAPVS